MKLPFEIDIDKHHLEITWGGPDREWFWWQFFFWEKSFSWVHDGKTYYNRRWAYEKTYYDGPIAQLKLWYFCVTWHTPWTSIDDE